MLIPVVDGNMMLTPEQALKAATGAEYLENPELAQQLDEAFITSNIGKMLSRLPESIGERALMQIVKGHRDYSFHVVSVGPYSVDAYNTIVAAYKNGEWIRYRRSWFPSPEQSGDTPSSSSNEKTTDKSDESD